MMIYLCSHPSACDATTRDGLQPRERCANGHAPCWWEPVPFRPTPEILMLSDLTVTCRHGFAFCAHDLCALDCSARECEPTLDHEYACECIEHGCRKTDRSGLCRGECGCSGCRRAHLDAMDGPT